MYSENEKKYFIEREQQDAKGSIKVVKRDFYDDLPRAVCDVLDTISWRWRNYPWFEEAWEKYREHVINASANGLAIKAPGFVFNDYIDEQVKEDFLNRESMCVLHSDSDLEELFHHGVKGQKWGVRRYVNENGTLTKKGKENAKHDITVGIGAAGGAAAGAAIGWKKFRTSPQISKTGFKKAIAKTALMAVGGAILGGFLGHKVNQLKKTYEDNQKKPLTKREHQSFIEKRIGRSASDADKVITGNSHIVPRLSRPGVKVK